MDTSIPIPSSLSLPPDPFFGLTTEPPGEWRVVPHGPDLALLLKGDDPFLDRAIVMLSTFDQPAPGHRLRYERVFEGVIRVFTSEARMIALLKRFFYCQVYRVKAMTEPILDDDGDVVDTNLLNEADLVAETDRLASAFYTTLLRDGLSCRVDSDYSRCFEEYRVASFDTALPSMRDADDHYSTDSRD